MSDKGIRSRGLWLSWASLLLSAWLTAEHAIDGAAFASIVLFVLGSWQGRRAAESIATAKSNGGSS